MFACFAIPSYRFQWFADVFSAAGLEMGTVILAWYVLVTTDSPFLTALIAALRHGGSLIAPFAGVLADRMSRRSLLLALRVSYAALAASLAAAALLGALPLAWVFSVAALGGLLRPTEILVRQSLIADTVPRAMLTNALGFGRTTLEGARIVGPLIGAAVFSALGIGPAYLCIALTYLASILLSVRITVPARARDRIRARPWAELLDGIAYMRRAPAIVTCMLLAFLANLTAFPVTLGLLPVIARDVFASDENGLARMTAAVAAGALAGSILVAVAMRNAPPERVMLASLAIWHALIAVLALTGSPMLAYPLLVLIGLSASGSMIPIAVVLMSQSDADYRGRVMGVRMLAVYGLPLGLLAGGALFEWIGIAPTLLAYGGGGLLVVLLIGAQWRRQASL